MDTLRNGFQLLKGHILRKPERHGDHPACQFETDKTWLDLQFHDDSHIKRPDELENEMEEPPGPIDAEILDRIQGSLIGLALGDALGAHVEFRPHEYLLENPVKDLEKDDHRNLKEGQFTDDTSMALCLANSLLARRGFLSYDQLVRYKWWYQYGYMSSTAKCFNIGTSTKQALDEFIRRQHAFAEKRKIPVEKLDHLSDHHYLQKFNVDCSMLDAAGNGALVRLAPVPLFFYEHVHEAVELSGYSGQITHGDTKAYDACRYYGALIFAALHNYEKEELLDRNFYKNHRPWFGDKPLCNEIRKIAEGSYQKKGGYEDGIRGKGYIVNALEAALWAFWSDDNSFEKGVLAAVNLGDDTDTTAAIYGQLAGVYYGYKKIPEKWLEKVYAKKFIEQLSKWIAYEGKNWKKREVRISSKKPSVGIIRSNSAENLPSNKIEASCADVSLTRHYETEPTGKKPVRTTIVPSNIDSKSAKTSTLTTTANRHSTKSSKEKCKAADNGPIESKVLDLKHCTEWSCDNVCDWIRSLGAIYETYINGFQQHNIDGCRLLNFVDDDALKEFGVTSSHNRRVIIYSIQQLKDKQASSMISSRAPATNFYTEYDGDFVPQLSLTDSTYPYTMSCVLNPRQDKKHLVLYDQIINWLEPLPIGIDIDKIELVHNAQTYRMFLQQMNRTERQKNKPAFQPHLDMESNPTERRNVLDRLQSLIQQVNHNRDASVVRVWHGCKRDIVSQLVSDGFAALGKLDNGWFGKAMYFTSSAAYAAKYTNPTGCLIMCYVVLLNPFPVITDDAPPSVPSKSFRFYGTGNYANYQCHYIPVAPVDEETSWNFRPPPNGVQDAMYDEFAIFQQSDILPQVIVHLKPGNTTSDTSDENFHRIFLSKE